MCNAGDEGKQVFYILSGFGILMFSFGASIALIVWASH